MGTAREHASTADRRRFDLRRRLGAGGFGEVYLATMTSPGGVRADVALKMLHPDLDPKGQALQRMRDEARLLGMLNHPAIVRIYDLILLDGRITLVSEFVDGADLDVCFASDPPMPQSAILQVVGAVASALQAAYVTPGANGEPLRLLHRDIKPSNVRIGRYGQVKLLDFGIAKAAGHGREAHTQANTIVGSFPYMAPERFVDGPDGDTPASDVFSLGCTLYEALARQRLFNLGLRQMFALALRDDRHRAYVDDRLAALTETPPGVIDLLRSMLACAPASRPSIAALGAACERLSDGPSVTRWCRDHAWGDLAAHDATSGPQLIEGSFSQAPTYASDADWPTLDPHRPTTLPERPGSDKPSSEDTIYAAAPQPDRPRAARTRASWLAVGGAGASLLGLVVFIFASSFWLGLWLGRPA